MHDKPKIKVVQYMWGEQNRSYDWDRKINGVYCARHGYEHIVQSYPPRPDRAWNWEKIPAIREELYDCDFLLFLDADAFFYSHELTIEEELLPMIEDKQIMMAADYASEWIRHQPDKPNSGVILVRNTEKAAEILRIWDESSERPELEKYRFELYHEQEACFQSVWQEFAEDVKLVKNYFLLNGFCGMFIRHFMGMTDEQRLGAFRNYLSRKQLIPFIDDQDFIQGACHVSRNF